MSNNQEYKKVWVKDLVPGQHIQSLFQLTRMNLREYDKGKFLTLRLGDKTGKVSAILWSMAEEMYKKVSESDVVQIDGNVGTYQGDLQIKINAIHPVQDTSQLTMSDFLPVSKIPLEQLTADFDEMMEAVSDADYKSLLLSFRQDTRLWKRFSTAPGAKRWHHPHLHGLLEHTLCVVKLCRLIAPFYPEINVDLLVAGAVFHDCGKLEEYTYDTYIDFSTEGRLFGHLFQGAFIVEQLIQKQHQFPPEKRMQLLHIIISHHGEVERSPVLPMTLEASLLHHIENMDAQMAAIRREMLSAQDEKKAWTGYIKLLERSLYLGEKGSQSHNRT